MISIAFALAILTFISCTGMQSESSALATPLDVTDRELRAALDPLDWVTIRTEQGTDMHSGTIFVLATWLDDQIFAQWNLENDRVTKVVVIVDPSHAKEPFLVDYQNRYVETITGLVVPGWGNVTEWLYSTWSTLSQHETKTPSAIQRYRNINAKVTVYTAINVGIVEFTADPNGEAQ